MARNRGQGSYNAHSGKSDWEFELDRDTKELVKDNIGSKRYKLYKVFSKYYLTSESDVYLGRIELTEPNKGVSVIETSHSNMRKGFYNIIFTSILGNTNIKEILSDTELSNQAIKSYSKLSRLNNIKINIWNMSQGKMDYSEESLLSDGSFRVSITESWNLHEVFKRYNKRYLQKDINENSEDKYLKIHINTHRRSYLEKCSSLDNFLFSENWSEDVI